jgi:poly(hydroxyalkanoate) granule associated protein phasin
MLENPHEPTSSERGPLDRFTDLLRHLDEQIEEAVGRFDARLKEVQERVERSWKDSGFYERAREARSEFENRREQLQKGFEDTAFFRRAQQTQRRFEEQFAEARSQWMARLGLVSRSELEKLSSRLEELARKLRELAEHEPPRQQ